MSDLLEYFGGLGLLAGASWRIYFLRIVRKVYKDTKDPRVLEYAKVVFDRPPLLGSPPPQATHDPPPASPRSRVFSRLRAAWSGPTRGRGPLH